MWTARSRHDILWNWKTRTRALRAWTAVPVSEAGGRARHEWIDVEMTPDDQRDLQRRDFFRDAASRMIEPLVDYLAPAVERPVRRQTLRPPGAIEESRFVDTCRRCGACVEVCPAEAIFPLDESHGTTGGDAGTPAIDPSRAACVVCDNLKCTHVCPSGALLAVLDPRAIRMGLAAVYASLCTRTRDEECSICVDRCPLGLDAIRLNDEGPPEVLQGGCIGCGICELYCPVAPKAVTVAPL